MKQCDNCKSTNTGKNARMVYPIKLYASMYSASAWDEILLWEGELCESCTSELNGSRHTEGPVPEVLVSRGGRPDTDG